MKKLLMTLSLLATTSAFGRVGYLKTVCSDASNNVSYKYWAYSNGSTEFIANSFEVTKSIDELTVLEQRMIDTREECRNGATPNCFSLYNIVKVDGQWYIFKKSESTFSYSAVQCSRRSDSGEPLKPF